MLTGAFRSPSESSDESTREDSGRRESHGAQFEQLEKRELLAVAPVMDVFASYNSGGSTPEAVVAADFNGDDIQDLAVANRNGHTVGILLGNGNGSFASALTFAHSGYTPTGLAVADFNGDTVPDIAVSNYSSNNVGVLIGFGDGTFWNTLAPASGGSHPQAVASGDFDGDGHQDIAVVNYDTFTHTVGVLLGNGNGTFASAVTFDTGGTSPLAVTTGDFDDNGVADIAVANYYDGTVGVLISNGDGTFAGVSTFATGAAGSRSVAAADIDGDAVQDIVVGNFGSESDNVGVLLSDGAGSFAPVETFATGGAALNSGGVAVADFNGDGTTDIAVTNYDSGTIGLLANNGDGTFADAATSSTGGSGPVALAVGDFNGDAMLDIAAANSASDTVSILLNGGVVAVNAEPVVAADSALVTVDEGDLAQNTGTFSDTDSGDEVTITASAGTITQDAGNSGTWAWELATTDGPDQGQTVTITATDGEGASSSTSFDLVVNNVAPTAADDGYAVDEDDTLQVDAASGLLINDTDPGDDPLTAALVSGPANGALTLAADGSFTYAPNADFNGADSFTYNVNDGDADGNTATVSITVNAVNDQPAAEGQSVTTYVDEALDIVLTGSDTETAQADLVFTIESLPSSGVLMQGETVLQAGDVLADPAVTYVPGIESDAASASFTFTVTDTGDGASPALESGPATVTIAIEQHSGVGVSDGVLTFGGGAGADTVTSQGGNLIINGTPVSTDGLTEIRIWTGDGDDTIDLSGLSIPTMVYAGAGDDTIVGGSGDDIVLGGAGSDIVTGAGGDDLLIGGDDADRVVGSSGNDILVSGSFGSDATLADLRGLLAYWADQVITSEEGDATDEIVEEDDSRDVLTGSSGADWFIISVGDRITDMSGRLKKLISAGVGGEYGDNYVTFV